MEDKEHQQKPGMWHQDSAGSIFSDRGVTGSGGGTGYSGLPVSVQELQGRPRMMELKRDSAGSLGISLCPGEGSVGGVYIMSLSPACQAASKGRLNPGDQILEVRQSTCTNSSMYSCHHSLQVNGRDLRRATQAEAVNVIKMAGNPVRIVVQSSTRSMQHSSPLHSNVRREREGGREGERERGREREREGGKEGEREGDILLISTQMHPNVHTLHTVNYTCTVNTNHKLYCIQQIFSASGEGSKF